MQNITEKAIEVLNEALNADRECLKKIFGTYYPCNDKIASHPYIQVKNFPKIPEYPHHLGTLGLINGIIEPLTGKKIAAMYSDTTGELIGFTEYLK
jgi:hypothetical protein